jgi:hypothetical protein
MDQIRGMLNEIRDDNQKLCNEMKMRNTEIDKIMNENKKFHEENRKLREEIKDSSRFSASNPWSETCKDSSKSSPSLSKRPKTMQKKKFKKACGKCQLTGHGCTDNLAVAHVNPQSKGHLLETEFGGTFGVNHLRLGIGKTSRWTSASTVHPTPFSAIMLAMPSFTLRDKIGSLQPKRIP